MAYSRDHNARQTGVQQGDPLGPFLFAVALNSTIQSVDPNGNLLFHAWYLDDGVFAGTRDSVLCVLDALQDATTTSVASK